MKPVDFVQSVRIDGTEIAGITLVGSTITYGSGNPNDPSPPPGHAYLELVSYDGSPDVANYPGISWRGGLRSGFETAYIDTYEGVDTSLTIGARAEVVTTTPGGFEQVYVDEYLGGYESTRFTGTIAAIDYTPGVVSVTAIVDSERLTRVDVDESKFPQETETSRVARIAAAAGVPITIEGTSTVELVKGPDQVAYANAYTSLSKVAADCDGVFYTRRHGTVVYRTHNAGVGGDTVRTNLVPNPNLEAGISGWATFNANASIAVVAGSGPVGGNILRVTKSSAAGSTGGGVIDVGGLAGLPEITAGVWCYCSNLDDAPNLNVRTMKSGVQVEVIGIGSADRAGEWTWLGGVVRPSILDFDAVQIRLRANTNSISGTVVDFDGVLAEAGTTPGDYFDGSHAPASAPQAATAWTGTPNLSTSTSTTPYVESTVAIEPSATLIDSLKMTQEAGTVVNRVTVTYGQNQTVTVEDTESITAYGVRDQTYATTLATLAAATAHGQRVLDHFAWPYWYMPTVDVSLSLARRAGDNYPENLAEILDLDLDDAVVIGPLLPGSPVADYTSRVLGYTEILDPYNWTLRYDLNPAGWTRKPL